MNYYEHHLGDYLRDTAHLSMLEDGAYRRLLDAYYIKELPLPKAVREVCRLARAITKQDRDAVSVVLHEFFHEEGDGWHHTRCDAEIDKYRASRPDAEAKKENAKVRQQRTRDRRKTLFKELRNHGIVAPWDATTEQLQDALVTVLKGANNAPVTPPVTRDDTATQSPDTSPQLIHSEPNGSGAEAPPPDFPDGEKPPQKPKLTDPGEIIFGYGLALLTNAGTKDATARSFLGGLRKVHGDAALINKLRACAKEKPLQPLEWLAGALPPPNVAGKPNAQEALEASNNAVLNKFLTEESHAAQ